MPPATTALTAVALAGDLQAGVADGQVTQQAGQDLFSHLRPLLPGPPGQNPQQVQDQFTQLAATREQHQSKGDITGKAATTVPSTIAALGVRQLAAPPATGRVPASQGDRARAGPAAAIPPWRRFPGPPPPAQPTAPASATSPNLATYQAASLNSGSSLR